MPESPEVQALAEFLDTRIAGRIIAATELVEFRALKTRPRPLDELVDRRIAAVGRRGKHLDIALDEDHLVVSLGRHGWARWSEPGEPPEDQADPPTLASLAFDDGGLLEFTDAGSWVSLGLSVVDEPGDVSAVAKLGPDPADPAFAREDFDRAVRGRRKQVKALLQEQDSLAGIGNAYSDEILYAARISPVAHASALDDAALDRLFTATVDTVREAVAARRGIPIDRLKEAKTAAMHVHGRTGEPCPECGGVVEDYRTGGTVAQYCPACQT